MRLIIYNDLIIRSLYKQTLFKTGFVDNTLKRPANDDFYIYIMTFLKLI
jgi:hypothetical protein